MCVCVCVSDKCVAVASLCLSEDILCHPLSSLRKESDRELQAPGSILCLRMLEGLPSCSVFGFGFQA